MLPTSIVNENRIGIRWGIVFAAVIFLLIYLPWITPACELFRHEGLYAACAGEYTPGLYVTAHGVVQSKVFPLYPMTVALLQKIFSDLPVETALRIVSITMMAAWAFLASAAVARRRNIRCALVTFCCCTGTLLTMEKGINGGAETMTAFFLLAAQLSFFHFGSRKANWDSAWIWSAVFLVFAFLCGGLTAIIFFVFPMFFFRRPLSLRSKFNTPGFPAGVVVVSLFVILWAVPLGLALRETTQSVWEDFSMNYFKELLTFPFLFPCRMLPWFVLGWMPFCVALQATDPTPVFSRYLRTLFFSSLFLLWFMPSRVSARCVFVIAPLAMMTGLYYEAGIRCYGRSLRKLLVAGEIFLTGLFVAAVSFCLLPGDMLSLFGNAAKMSFRTNSRYLWIMAGVSVLLAGLAAVFHFGRRKLPVWILVLMISGGLTLFYTSVMLPYRMQKQELRQLAGDINNALAKEKNADVLYKYELDGLYGGLFYTGRKIRKWQSAEWLRDQETVYLISAGIPRDTRRIWSSTPLLFRNTPLSLWKGELRKDNFDDAGAHNEL